MARFTGHGCHATLSVALRDREGARTGLGSYGTKVRGHGLQNRVLRLVSTRLVQNTSPLLLSCHCLYMMTQYDYFHYFKGTSLLGKMEHVPDASRKSKDYGSMQAGKLKGTRDELQAIGIGIEQQMELLVWKLLEVSFKCL